MLKLKFLLNTTLPKFTDFLNYKNVKILVSKDINFMKNQQWSWEEPMSKQLPKNSQFLDGEVDDIFYREIQVIATCLDTKVESLSSICKRFF